MDTTVKYIKMCGKAREIQLYRTVEKRCEAGDFAYNDDEGIIEVQETGVMLLAEDVWLPRQDQLQEMVAETSGFDGKRMIGLELCNLWAWYQQNRPGDIGVEIELWPSWEQLWLKLVMKIKYDKLWDDKKEKWIK